MKSPTKAVGTTRTIGPAPSEASTPASALESGTLTEALKPIAISPTVGRVMWYYDPRRAVVGEVQDPLAAHVAAVLSADRVNVMFIGYTGVPSNDVDVRVIQEGEPVPTDEAYVTWMPFQVGQAKRHAAEGR